MLVVTLFITVAGYVIGLGAVTVIDIHGFLGRKSHYWTEATTRTHKVTKPLIWLGTLLALAGGLNFYNALSENNAQLIHGALFIALILNGLFLSFKVSPFLLERERNGASGELLPTSWQRKITASFIVSFIGWWGGLALLAYTIASRLSS